MVAALWRNDIPGNCQQYFYDTRGKMGTEEKVVEELLRFVVFSRAIRAVHKGTSQWNCNPRGTIKLIVWFRFGEEQARDTAQLLHKVINCGKCPEAISEVSGCSRRTKRAV